MNIRNITLLWLFTLNFCTAQTNYVHFFGNIENRNSDTLRIFVGTKKIKTLKVDMNGNFDDTLNVQEGLYTLSDKVESTTIFLKNGFDIQVKFNGKEFDESIHYDGIGGNENNYLAKQILLDEAFAKQYEIVQDEQEFNALVTKKKDDQMLQLTNGNFDSKFVEIERERLIKRADVSKKIFKEKLVARQLKNTKSPVFTYENVMGGVTKLEDFKGKFVFIDIWATWCAPCIKEIPYLKKAEETYKEKNIVFISISIDYLKKKVQWKKFIADKQLTGVQVIADKDWQSQFMKDYAVSTIPRFILIDPEGKVLDANAARPSSPRFVEELDRLLN
ncbi:TlpA disulfide reductase family protein [Dyadobacter sp. CY347]|uniref:TlpA family protein disulfide reductase n=1 Tax=Dyadobacter sp. CY347 TaxID=2909336 RepID=UPI001F33562F|nr:TlpA disulfide reductase family protein [Dyadobacter sp. CY347]MCF2491476.1 TlpA family protein disulfide reductase [Dyadobacter sp. CY347]